MKVGKKNNKSSWITEWSKACFKGTFIVATAEPLSSQILV